MSAKEKNSRGQKKTANNTKKNSQNVQPSPFPPRTLSFNDPSHNSLNNQANNGRNNSAQQLGAVGPTPLPLNTTNSSSNSGDYANIHHRMSANNTYNRPSQAALPPLITPQAVPHNTRPNMLTGPPSLAPIYNAFSYDKTPLMIPLPEQNTMKHPQNKQNNFCANPQFFSTQLLPKPRKRHNHPPLAVTSMSMTSMSPFKNQQRMVSGPSTQRPAMSYDSLMTALNSINNNNNNNVINQHQNPPPTQNSPQNNPPNGSLAVELNSDQPVALGGADTFFPSTFDLSFPPLPSFDSSIFPTDCWNNRTPTQNGDPFYNNNLFSNLFIDPNELGFSAFSQNPTNPGAYEFVIAAPPGSGPIKSVTCNPDGSIVTHTNDNAKNDQSQLHLNEVTFNTSNNQTLTDRNTLINKTTTCSGGRKTDRALHSYGGTENVDQQQIYVDGNYYNCHDGSIGQQNSHNQPLANRNVTGGPVKSTGGRRQRNAANKKKVDEDPIAASKRENHNRLERHRRLSLKQSFNLLSKTLPSLANSQNGRVSKVKILAATTEHIRGVHHNRQEIAIYTNQKQVNLMNSTLRLAEIVDANPQRFDKDFRKIIREKKKAIIRYYSHIIGPYQSL